MVHLVETETEAVEAEVIVEVSITTAAALAFEELLELDVAEQHKKHIFAYCVSSFRAEFRLV